MGIDIQASAVVAGAVVVGVNALVTNFTSWMTARALRNLERHKEEKTEKDCECRTCPMFEKCKMGKCDNGNRDS